MIPGNFDTYRQYANRAQTALFCLTDALEDIDSEWLDLASLSAPSPPITWPSTLPVVETHCNGFYGLTTFAAEKGTGKTMLATASAIEAAATQEWQVVYFLAEDDYDGFATRFNTYLNAHPHAQDCIEYFHVQHVGRNQTPVTLTSHICSAVDRTLDTPVLIVLDSINSIVNLAHGNYLSMLKDFGLWAMLARRLSRGLCSFMLTSESNKRGESKGETLPYWSDLYLQMKKKGDSVVEFKIEKTRRTGGEGTSVNYRRAWDRGCFVGANATTSRLRLVSGEPAPQPFGLGDDEYTEDIL
jgi:hypothetical protein